MPGGDAVEGEEPLSGGNTSGLVHRVGATVRKPWTSATGDVQEYLRGLAGAGIEVPAPLGRDERGRQVLEYIPGELAMERGPLDLGGLRRVGALVRRIHDASPPVDPAHAGEWVVAIPVDGPYLICHNDLAPWNLVIGDRWVFIDWDGAGPSTRLWDLAYAAQAFAGLQDGAEPVEAGRRLAAIVEGYGASPEERAALADVLVRRVRAMSDLLRESAATGAQPWARMYHEGHGAHWAAASDYVLRHRAVWVACLA